MTTDLVSVDQHERIAVVRFERRDAGNALSLALSSEDCAQGVRAFPDKRSPAFGGH